MASLDELDQLRLKLRNQMDAVPDLATTSEGLHFRQTFLPVHAAESYCEVPKAALDAARNLLKVDLIDPIAKIVHDTVTFTLGCNVVPVFRMVSGGRGRTLFQFKCVFEGCSAFMELRRFCGADRIKWVVIFTSHSHSFASFPQRLPRNTFSDDTLSSFECMVSQNRTCGDIRVGKNVLCSKHVFENAVREARALSRTDQSRALRNAVGSSDLWSSEIHLDAGNHLLEAFFINNALLSLRLDVNFVFVDDTSCVNALNLPVIAVLFPAPSTTNHVVAWGFIKNRTTQTLARFFSFVFRFFPTINTFMCDRHFAQRRAISLVFGEGVNIFHCCVHVARNIKAHTGHNSTLVSSFWKMRSARTRETEEQFVDTVNRLHSSKRTVFTSHLVNTLHSFLPSKVDGVLKRPLFPELETIGGDALSVVVSSDGVGRAVAILRRLLVVRGGFVDVFSLDNTNAIESFFNVVKGRLIKETPTLVDVFNAITLTEEMGLASRNPASMPLSTQLVECFLMVVSHDVLNVLSPKGVHGLLQCIVDSALNIIRGKRGEDIERLDVVEHAIGSGFVISRLSWMPAEWVIPLERQEAAHSVVQVDVEQAKTPEDLLMRIEPFLSIVNRNTNVFKAINDTLTTLYSIRPSMLTNTAPITFSFLNREFCRFVDESKTDTEILEILIALCDTLENASSASATEERQREPRPSIADPVVPKMNGVVSKQTSSKVDGTALTPKTKMIEKCLGQAQQLKKPQRRTRHRCPVCLAYGHHASTCSGVVLPKNADRAKRFLRQLHDSDKLHSYVSTVALKRPREFSEAVVRLVKDAIGADGDLFHFENNN